MAADQPLLKRIKRHVVGKEREFFASVTPGIEHLCLKELADPPVAILTGKAEKGGISFTGRLADCYRANLHLRTANRILMRIDDFKASRFWELEENLVRIPWELYLFRGEIPIVRVTARHSRLYHSGAIAERFQKAIGRRIEEAGVKQPEEGPRPDPQQIFVRVLDDRFALSIDSSGEILYKRGIKKHPAAAPLRETIAAAALELAGYDGREPLIDPMCGSGTFSLEAAAAAQNIPAGWFRSFAFTGWPSFRSRTWAFMKREAGAAIHKFEHPRIFASDIDRSACDALEETLRRFGLEGAVRVSREDFFAFSPGRFVDAAGLVVLNPPFGIRIGTQRESRMLLSAVCEKLRNAYSGWKLALVVSDPHLAGEIPLPVRAHLLDHGGLGLTLLTGRIP